jgi:hypothetical protein
MSLFGALTPLGKAANGFGWWLKCASAYAFGGSISSILIGATLGLIGRASLSTHAHASSFFAISSLALLLAFRELKWIQFKLPECHRQTEKVWAHELGFVMASFFWGIHIGLGFVTRIRYGGFWILVSTALAGREPSYGVLLLLFYWFGRILPVLLGPVLVSSQAAVDDVIASLSAGEAQYRHITAAGLVCAAVAAVFVATA